MAILIAEDGTFSEIYSQNDDGVFDLMELKSAIGGGYIEHVALPINHPTINGKIPEGGSLLIDEEGKSKPSMGFNFNASLVASHLQPWDVIVGPALRLTPDEWS